MDVLLVREANVVRSTHLRLARMKRVLGEDPKDRFHLVQEMRDLSELNIALCKYSRDQKE